MIKAGIIGGAGYTAGELIRLLINHPETEIVFINSSSNACLLYTSPSPRDRQKSRMPSSA